ncbi:MAG: ABC transporter permease [Eubacteriales bacterium]|nr:ABC transporter permease [Eubacteriales bacterium]
MQNDNFKKLTAMEKVMEATADIENNRKNALDDAQRIKVLSPGMLVLKRFLRNKLAIVGLVILIFMFIFSFVGPIFTPYSQTQIFTKDAYVFKDFANAKYNSDLLATTEDGKPIPNDVNVKFLMANGKNQTSFVSNKDTFTIEKLDSGAIKLKTNKVLGDIFMKGKIIKFPTGKLFDDEFQKIALAAIGANESSFVVNDVTYSLTNNKTKTEISVASDYAILSKNIFYAYSSALTDLIDNIAFKSAAENALSAKSTSFEVENAKYSIEQRDEHANIIKDAEGNNVALITDVLIIPSNKSTVLSMDYVLRAIDAIRLRENSFEFAFEGESEPTSYRVSASNNMQFRIQNEQLTKLHDTFAPPSKSHWAGTDEKAFDVFTRLMYGGRISLLVGFVVVFIEIFIGVIFGGVSGYFGGIVDLLLMRFIDLFNSIPHMPIMIILGSVMDTLEVPSTQRIFLLMLLLGFLGWTGIARVVRGQILTLREQDFMIATEATGLSVPKRIFRHLVPNVMPLLIVQSTLSLGSIIITEATLSFLGLGVKPPLASWGSIINAANDLYVMQTSWWVWIPTGILIVLTVLGFNFVGDGLRDAYDPKMKR